MPVHKFDLIQDFQFDWRHRQITKREKCPFSLPCSQCHLLTFCFSLYLRSIVNHRAHRNKKHYVFHSEKPIWNRFYFDLFSHLIAYICIQSFYRSWCFQKQKWSYWFNAFSFKGWALFFTYIFFVRLLHLRKCFQHSFHRWHNETLASANDFDETKLIFVQSKQPWIELLWFWVEKAFFG